MVWFPTRSEPSSGRLSMPYNLGRVMRRYGSSRATRRSIACSDGSSGISAGFSVMVFSLGLLRSGLGLLVSAPPGPVTVRRLALEPSDALPRRGPPSYGAAM
jgi:hypothetical protein